MLRTWPVDGLYGDTVMVGSRVNPECMHCISDRYYRRVLRQLLSSLLVACCAVPALSCELSAHLDFNEVAQGVYVHEGLHEDINARNCGDIANIGFIVGETSVAVIDPGGSPAIGRALRKAVQAVTALPIRYVVITHFHPDHLFGGNQMGENVIVVAHQNYSRALLQRGRFYLERYADLFSKSDSMDLVQPTVLVERQKVINLGKRELRLIAHKTAHTDNDLTVFDVESGVLWAGDLLFHQRIPSLDGSVTGWLDVMDELKQIAPEINCAMLSRPMGELRKLLKLLALISATSGYCLMIFIKAMSPKRLQSWNGNK